jgi:Matrixin
MASTIQRTRLGHRLIIGGAVMAAALIMRAGTPLDAWVSNGHAWGASQVPYYVNPANISGLAATDIVNDLSIAAATWPTQANIPTQLAYAGSTTASSAVLDYKNNVFFRNDSNGSAGATTYWWYDGSGHLVDFDMIFWESGYLFFVNNSGCHDNGEYIQDLATHEFGHALGLAHTTVATATMYPYNTYCDTTWETLDSDDVVGIQSLYPPQTTVPSAPSQLAVTAKASSPTSSLALAWVDTATNASGYNVDRSSDGVAFGRIAQLGSTATGYTDNGVTSGATYYYRVSAYNSAGTSAYSNIAAGQTAVAAIVTTPPSAPYNPSPANGATGVNPNLTLTWVDAGAQSYDVYMGSTLYASNVMTTSLSVSSLNASTTYSWMVVAKNPAGSTAGPTWSFTTKAAKGKPTK